MAVEKNESDLTEDLAKPSARSWFKVRDRKGHVLSYSAAAFGTGIVIFAVGFLVGLATSDLNLFSALAGVANK